MGQGRQSDGALFAETLQRTGSPRAFSRLASVSSASSQPTQSSLCRVVAEPFSRARSFGASPLVPNSAANHLGELADVGRQLLALVAREPGKELFSQLPRHPHVQGLSLSVSASTARTVGCFVAARRTRDPLPRRRVARRVGRLRNVGRLSRQRARGRAVDARRELPRGHGDESLLWQEAREAGPGRHHAAAKGCRSSWHHWESTCSQAHPAPFVPGLAKGPTFRCRCRPPQTSSRRRRSRQWLEAVP